MLISEKSQNGGFNVVSTNSCFKCAFIRHSGQYSFGEVHEMKRHNETDEIFVLLSGHAVIITFENDIFKETVLEKETSYNVTKGTYHYLALDDEAVVFVTEKSDTSSENTDVFILKEPYIIKKTADF